MKHYRLLFAAIVLALCSCTKTSDPELGEEFQCLEYSIDMSKSNRFDEALFCKSWERVRAIEEEFIDGQLVRTSDVTERYGKGDFTFHKDHTMSSTNGVKGTWLYSHNYIMLHQGPGYTSYEVVEAKKGVLHLRMKTNR